MSQPHGFIRDLGKVGFDEAQKRITAALKEEGFGVLTEIDMKEKLKEKLGVDFRRYKIFGACNPSLAHEALQMELSVGLLLPCNVAVYEKDDGTVTVAVGKPSEIFSVVGDEELRGLAGRVDEKVSRALEKA